MPQRKNRFDDATLDKFDINIREVAEKALDLETGLYIFGTVGTGKTFLCHALEREIRKKTTPVKLLSVPELFLMIKATFNKEYSGESEKEIVDKLSGISSKWDEGVKTLFLDDIGTEKPTEWAQQTLFTIIDRRYQRCKQTIFTSNLSLDELSAHLGDRITSRIAEMCKIIKLEGNDRRLRK